MRLGAPEKASSLQTGMIEGMGHPRTATKLTCGVSGIATTAAVGLYLYKKRRTTKTKNADQEEVEEKEEHSDSVDVELEHSDSVLDPMEDIV